MRALVSTLLALFCVPMLASGADGAQKRIPWLTFNQVSLDGKRRVLSRHDVFPNVSSLSPARDRFAHVDYTCDGCPRSNRLMVADVRGPGDQLLGEASRGISDVAWAPNGRTIAFISDAVWLVDADGTNLRRVADVAAGLSWSPDSRSLAFIRLNDQLQTVISVLALDSGEERALTRGFGPRWSPNGKSLLFEYVTGRRNEEFKIRVVPAAGGFPRTVARGHSPSWSPNGKRIAFGRYNDHTSSVWVAPGPRREAATNRTRAQRRRRDVAVVSGLPPTSNTAGTQFCRNTVSVVRVAGGRPRRLATQARRLTPLAWTDGGRKVLYSGEKCSDQ